MQTVRDTVVAGGHVIIAAFALDGPTRCSNLDIMQHSPETLQDELGDAFVLVESCAETHVTPWNSEQKFVYCRFKRSDL
jgi:hypothetical protein